MGLTVPKKERSDSAPKIDSERLPNQNAEAALSYSIRQGVIGGLYGLAGSTAFSLFAQRFSPMYRSVTLPGKLILVTVVTAGAATFASERSIYYFNRPFLAAEHTSQSSDESWPAFALRHRFEIVGGLSTAGILGAILYVARDRNKTASEKFMSIRLFSQAAALMTLLGAVGAGALAAHRKQMESEAREQREREKKQQIFKK